MTVLNSGHYYSLDSLDGNYYQTLRFVMRLGPGYPGNLHTYSGCLIQEVLRALIDRTQYLHKQIPCWINPVCVFMYRTAINLLEWRAARRHDVRFRWRWAIEKLPVRSNGHVY